MAVQRPFLFSAVFALALFGSLHADAQEPAKAIAPSPIGWERLAGDQKAIVDRLAADFFKESLRLSQSRRIEAATAQIYLSLDPEHREAFRAERMRLWTEMSEEERKAFHNVKRPEYGNLTETQKLPFRRNALETLGLIGPAAPYERGAAEI
jgi:hypothetical protein